MTESAVPKKRRVLRLLALQVIVLIGGLLLAEAAWRIVLRVRGTPYDSRSGAHELERQMSRARDFVPRLGPDAIGKPEDTRAQIRVTHPFLGWENLGGLEQLQLEATRLRSHEFDGDLEILTLGGSVAEMFGQYGVPRLEERLRADPRFASKRIYWYRYARGGFKQPQQVNMLTWLLGQGFTPDIVVNLDGFNEVALGMDNAKRGTSPLYPAITLWGNLAAGSIADRDALDAASRGRDLQKQAQTLAERALDWHAHWSALATTLVVRRLNGQRQAMNEAFDVYAAALKQRAEEGVLTGPPYGNDPGVVAQRSVTLWSECSRMSRAICESRGIFYLHVLQPTLHDPGAKPATSEELANGKAPDTWLEGVELGYPRLRKAGAALAQDGEHFLDASGVFRGIERTIYIDSCHFLEDGNRVLADAIADELLRRHP